MKMDARGGDYARRISLPWQQRALEYIDLIPECNYASRFYSRMVRQLRIFPGTLDDQGKVTPITSGPPVDILNVIQDPGGGRSQILGNYGRLMFTTGEGQLFGRDLGSEDEKWSFVWNEELTFSEGRITWKPTSMSQGTEYGPNEAVAYRMWNPSPRRSGEADSPMHAALEVAEELLILTKAVRATAVSRMVNGIFLLPQEMSPGAAEPVGDEDPDNNPFLEDMLDHWSGQIENAGSAEASLPWLLEGPSEFLVAARWMQMHDPQNDYMERDLRKEAVERMARGFDMPPEVLLGLSDANHWAARQILEDMWKSHGSAIAEQFCDDLNEAYLRPALREDGYAGWDQVVIGYDPSEIVSKPDRSTDALAVWNAGGIGWPALRSATNFAESDAPTPEERELWLALKMREPSFVPSDVVPPQAGPTPQPSVPQPADQGPPSPGPSGTSRPDGRTASAKILGAAELALIRCREVAGSKILSYRTEKTAEILRPAEDVPKAFVASLIGEKTLTKLGAPEPMKLVTGGTDGFRTLLEGWGFSDAQSEALSEMVSVYAARTLFEPLPPPLPSGFEAHIERVQDVRAA